MLGFAFKSIFFFLSQVKLREDTVIGLIIGLILIQLNAISFDKILGHLSYGTKKLVQISCYSLINFLSRSLYYTILGSQ